MSDKCFVDTNLWIYLYSEDKRATTVERLVDKHFHQVIISTQVLGECYSAMIRKRLCTPDRATNIIDSLMESFEVAVISVPTVKRAVGIQRRYGFSYYDSQMIAAALEQGCAILYSEDMHHGQVLEGSLTIINPFQ
uniref:Predicted nucleic acid-binding protein, contains PIN domain n=1 Tax=Candidatus Kentrum sp. FM TaxID=2126340 RepID=A0A450W010_9GAMM|nr:MAG: Predicted nucleic acid-binding protein, contains PIN domain [Candidatus Kentron sp. FM]VFJ50820.1 MAG: Predicted nucleic acid-binding protein, contains PIN domain [Candidatus Kentron sp. FM]VFK10352.1 MAG: Predicted nucleic acid-binding protein, contains PIN domain [Candidatus Kentron sp. FM]